MMLIDFINQIIDDSTNVNHIQLVGQGGSSKTFQLLNVYNCLSKLDNTIPIYIPLVEAITKNGYSLFRFIERHYLDVEVEYDLDLMAKRILDLFTDNEQYKFVLLLDGYNEVVSNFEFRSDAHGVNLEIQELNALPNVTIIISTRYVLTGKTFPDYCIVDMLPLNQDQIDALLPNRSAFDERLNGILRIPFYLDVYRRLCKEDNYDSVLNPISSEGELLQYYYFSYLPKKFLDENKLDSDNLYYEQFLFCLNSLLPKIAYFMHQKNTMRITEKQIDDCFISIDNFHAKSWDIMDLIRNYLVPTGIMFQSDNDDETEKYYIFRHGNIEVFFFAIFWINETDKETISPDVLKLRLTHSEMCYIGDILGEYKYTYILKKDYNESSSVENRISKYRGIFNDFAVQTYISTCVEIMKKKRYHITAVFSNLDLSLCDFTNVECPNCNFSGSLIKSSTFIASVPLPISIIDTRLWSDGTILINFYEDCSIVAYNLQTGKELYSVVNQLHNKEQIFISITCNTSNIYIDSDIFYINDEGSMYESIYKFNTYTGKILEHRFSINIHKEQSLFERVINRLYQKYYDRKKIKYYLIDTAYDYNYNPFIFYDPYNNVFCYVRNNKHLVFLDETFEKIGEFSLETYGQLIDRLEITFNYTQFGWYITESASHDKLFFLKLCINKDSISVEKKYELLHETYVSHLVSGVKYVKVLDEKSAVVLCVLSSPKLCSRWYYIDLVNQQYSFIENEKWVRHCGCGKIGFINNGSLNNIACFFHSESKRNLTLFNYLTGFSQDLDLSYYFGNQEYEFIVGCFDFGIVIESNNKICVFDKEFRWQRTLLKNSSAIIESMYFEDDTLNCCIKKLKSQNGIDEKHFRDLYRYNINDKSVEISSLGFEDFYLVQHGFYTFLLSKVVYINKHNGILVLECTYRHHMYAVIKFTDHADEKRVNHIMNIVGFNCDVYPKSNVIIQNNPATVIDIFTPDEIYNQALADYDNKDNEGKGVISESFNIIDDHLLFCKSETSCTKMYRVDIENANMQIVATLREGGNYGSCEISDQYVFCSMWEQLDSSYYRNKSSVLIDIYSTEGSFIESIDINEVIQKNDSVEYTSIESIQSISFSNKSDTLAVLDSVNRIFLFSLSRNMDHIDLTFIRTIQVLPSVNITGCDFTDIKISDEEENGNTLNVLLENGGIVS